MVARRLELITVADFPLVEPGDDIAQTAISALDKAQLCLQVGDIVVVAQKIISKAEGRYRILSSVRASAEAQGLARKVDKDPRLVQLILDESKAVIRHRPGVLIVEHKLGYVHANAGIDQSNIVQRDGEEQVLLLPENSDRSAAMLQAALEKHFAAELGVIVNDSAGRAWRNGTVGMAIGSAGIEPVQDLVGTSDLFERKLQVTAVAVADELAAAASFMMGQADEGTPLVIVRGAQLKYVNTHTSQDLLRPAAEDLFR
ncbi:MAG: coenzyme F420-0:L-glutamate ligase [Pseudomonadales bacterium]